MMRAVDVQSFCHLHSTAANGVNILLEDGHRSDDGGKIHNVPGASPSSRCLALVVMFTEKLAVEI
jgi:hypothetical protein